MRRRTAALALAGLGLAAGAALAVPRARAAPPPEGPRGDPIRGQALFVSKQCVGCHAVRGAGGRTGSDLGRAAVNGSFPEIAAGLWNHSHVMDEKMREFRLARPSFRGDELADLVAFLYFLNYFDEPGDPARGRALFAEKHCIRCHAVGREGGSIGPRLDAIPRGEPPLRIAQALWNHGPAMNAAMRRMGLEPPRFGGGEFLDLVAFLRSQGQRAGARAFRSAGDPEAGRRLFASKGCASCHEIFGRGGVGPDLGRADLAGSVTQLAGRMWNHWPEMAAAMQAKGMAPPTFARDELADVVAYLFLARYAGPPASAARGAAVYERRGCAACHGGEGEGNVGPRLLGRLDGEPAERIVQRMWNHAPLMGAEMSAQGLAWPRLEADELADLLAFLRRGTKAPGGEDRDGSR